MKQRSISEGARGQAALEYLMTYGWAILILLIVGIALWQMGVFNAPATPPGCSGFSQLVPIDSQFKSADSNFTVFVTNNAGTKLTLDSVDFTLGSDVETLNPAYSIRPGQSDKLSVIFSNKKLIPGEYYRINIVFTYTVTSSNIQHKSSGECWGTTE